MTSAKLFMTFLLYQCISNNSERAPAANQRILTFFLSCWLACSLCCGLSIAIIAGIAYGYNYCLAEFIVHTRADVRVYMRRGQFYDKPDLFFKPRRSGEDDDGFPSNLTDEYQQEVPPGDDSLAEHWAKDQDTRKYAEKLTKYSDSKNTFMDTEPSQEDSSDSVHWQKEQGEPRSSSDKNFGDADYRSNFAEDNFYHKLTTPPERRISILPHPIVHTAVIQSGSSEIVMRHFEPLSNITPEPGDEVDEYDDKALRALGKKTDSSTKPPEGIEKKIKGVSPDIRIMFEDGPTRKLLKMRHWGTSLKPVTLEYSTDVDEDNVVYKAV